MLHGTAAVVQHSVQHGLHAMQMPHAQIAHLSEKPLHLAHVADGRSHGARDVPLGDQL